LTEKQEIFKKVYYHFKMYWLKKHRSKNRKMAIFTNVFCSALNNDDVQGVCYIRLQKNGVKIVK